MILLIELQTSYTCVQINSICFLRGVLDNGDVSPVSLFPPPPKYTHHPPTSLVPISLI